MIYFTFWYPYKIKICKLLSSATRYQKGPWQIFQLRDPSSERCPQLRVNMVKRRVLILLIQTHTINMNNSLWISCWIFLIVFFYHWVRRWNIILLQTSKLWHNLVARLHMCMWNVGRTIEVLNHKGWVIGFKHWNHG